MPPNVVALFAGAGGFSRGFSDKFNIVLAVDIDEYAIQSYKANFKSTKAICSDIASIDWISEIGDLGLSIGDIDVVIGGPPCQGFSIGNQQSRDPEHPLNRLWRNYLDVVDILRPTWFVMENVPGMLNVNDHKTADRIIDEFSDTSIGYHVEKLILNAADFGVPQIRRRVVFVGSRDGFKFPFPEPQIVKEKYRNVGDAILGDLPSLEDGDGAIIEGTFQEINYSQSPQSKYQAQMRSCSTGISSHVTVKSSEAVRNRWRDIPPGGNWSSISAKNREGWRNVSDNELAKVSHSNLYKRLDPAIPAITITNFRRAMICHPQENRIISIREAARLQSFPDNHIFKGPKANQQQMVANAVPPLLSRAIGNQLYCVISGIIPVELSPPKPSQMSIVF